MSKYQDIKVLKEVKARTSHQCYNCGNVIKVGEIYYSEKLRDKFLHSLHEKKFCSKCYKKYGDDLLHEKKRKKRIKPRSELPLDGFGK